VTHNPTDVALLFGLGLIVATAISYSLFFAFEAGRLGDFFDFIRFIRAIPSFILTLALAPASTSTARRLLAGTVRLLPPAHQDRYLEEFRSEFDAIIEGGGNRWAQFAYTGGLFARIWQLRTELRAARRRSATP